MAVRSFKFRTQLSGLKTGAKKQSNAPPEQFGQPEAFETGFGYFQDNLSGMRYDLARYINQSSAHRACVRSDRNHRRPDVFLIHFAAADIADPQPFVHLKDLLVKKAAVHSDDDGNLYHLSGKEKESVSMHMILKYCFYLIDHFQINIHI